MSEPIPDKNKESNNEKQKIFAAIDDSDTVLLKAALSLNKSNVNIVDENSMTPLQHAAYKGNKEMVQLLIDYGADVNLCEHQHNYTALHFAGLSGNVDVCLMLLLAGAKSQVTNTVNRTAAQMAAFVGNHNCVATINNYIPKSEIEYYTGGKSPPVLPAFLVDSVHTFVMQINMHPVKIALNVQNYVGLSEHLDAVRKVLQSMSEREMKRGNENNEVISFKFHYLAYILNEIVKIRQRQITSSKKAEDEKSGVDDDKKPLDVTELFTRKLLKPCKDGHLEFMDDVLKECIREYSFRECTLFRQMVSSLAGQDPPTALSVIGAAINGQRGFVDNVTVCSTCGEERPAKKCSKCKAVQYCDRNCQRLHWHWHKKSCPRLSQAAVLSEIKAVAAAPDPAELSTEIQNLLVNEVN